jgi:soluble lytic murein transglycosylase-like protein
MVRNVIRWRPLIQRWQPELEHLQGLEGEALVMAVIAQESQGFADPHGIVGMERDRAGSVGLMQVVAGVSGRPSGDRLLDPALNTLWGMRILNGAIEIAEGEWRLGVATFNCWPPEKVLADGCGSRGGLHYADRVIEHFYPVFLARLQ